MSSALSASLEGYSHRRKRLVVHYSPLRGKRLSMKGTSLVFRKSLPKRRSRKGAVIIDHAVQYEASAGPIAIVFGRFPSEGLRFHVVVGQGGKQPEILFKSVVEN